MSIPPPPPPPPVPLTRREILAFVGVLALGIAALPLAGGAVLWTRPLWFDELCCVAFVVSDASSPIELISMIAAGRGDYAPPLLHLIVWPIARLAGGVTPVLLHSISLVFVSLALVLLYFTLRRRFDRVPSAAGTLVVASHSLVLAHAFEGRFYGPWLLFASGWAWSLGLHAGRRGAFAQAAFSVLIVTIHWFGVISLGLMSAAAVVAHGRPWRDGLRHIAPSAAGLIALIACLPMALTQRAGATGLLWVFELNMWQVREMAGLFWFSTATIIAGTLLLVGALRDDPAPVPLKTYFVDPSLAALTSLAAMPLAMMVVSKLLQPSMVPRYAIVAALAWGPLMAMAAASLGRAARFAVAMLAAVLLAVGVQRTIADKQEFADLFAAIGSAFAEAKAAQLPIAFTSLHIAYPVAGPERSPRSPVRYLDLPDSTIAALFPAEGMEPVRKKLRLDRDQARGHARAYGFPILGTQAQLDTTRRFFLLATDVSLPGGYKDAKVYGGALFPRHRVTRLNEFLSLFERTN